MLVVASIAISLLIIAVGFYIIPFNGEKFDIRKFNGDVVSVEGETVTLNGVFDGPSGTIPQDLLSDERDFSFQVDGATKFEEIKIGWPSWEQVAAAPGGHFKFNVSELSSNRVAGSLENLKNLSLSNPGTVYVEADFQASIYGSKNSVASFILYKLMTMPGSGPPTQTP